MHLAVLLILQYFIKSPTHLCFCYYKCGHRSTVLTIDTMCRHCGDGFIFDEIQGAARLLGKPSRCFQEVDSHHISCDSRVRWLPSEGEWRDIDC